MRHMASKTIKTGVLFRDVEIDRASVNPDERTAVVAFSSEFPVERFWGREILDHSENSIRLDFMRNGAPLLADHNRSKQIGKVVEVMRGDDRKLRAKVKFSRNATGEEFLRDVQDGIKSHASTGYRIHKMRLEKAEDGIETYRATDWEPLEVSLVAIPADPTVGIGRAAEDEKFDTIIEGVRAMGDETKGGQGGAPEAAQRARDEATRATEAEVRTRELARINALEQIGQNFAAHGGVDMARACIRDGKGEDDLRQMILDKIGKKAPPSADLGLSRKEVKQFSFVRAINMLANRDNRALYEQAGYEREVSEATAKLLGRSPQGIFIPMDVLRSPLVDPENERSALIEIMARMMGQRDLSVGTSTAGGHLVDTVLLASSFIDLLRKRLVLGRLGVTTLSGLVGNIAIPRQTSGATAYWVAEGGAPTESQQAFDQVTMSPKTVGAFTDYSRKLLLQSSIDVEALVRRDLTTVLALEIDRVGLYGSGASNQPLGLDNTSGINTVNFAAADPTYAEIVQMETEVAADNADIGSLAYALSASGRGKLKTTQKFSGTNGMPVWEEGNTVNGYRAEVSNQIAAADYWFGNWSDLLLGMWGALDLLVDPYTFSTSGSVRTVVLQDVDVAVRHPESFCQGNDNP